MEENSFKTDSGAFQKKDFLKRIGVIFGAAILLTGICAFAGVGTVIIGVKDGVWAGAGMASFARSVFEAVMMVLIFAALVKIAIDEKPFSKTLTWSIRIIGILFIAASFIIPRMQGYESSGFNIFSSGSFVLIDGAILVPGLLLVILGNIIMAGFDMQREMDEIL